MRDLEIAAEGAPVSQFDGDVIYEVAEVDANVAHIVAVAVHFEVLRALATHEYLQDGRPRLASEEGAGHGEDDRAAAME